MCLGLLLCFFVFFFQDSLQTQTGDTMRKKGFPGGSDGRESACNAGGPGFDPRVGMIPWRREWQSTPVFFPEEFHGQRSLASYSPLDYLELGTTE